MTGMPMKKLAPFATLVSEPELKWCESLILRAHGYRLERDLDDSGHSVEVWIAYDYKPVGMNIALAILLAETNMSYERCVRAVEILKIMKRI